MPSKKELIDYCQANNIFFRASWKKEEIQSQIDNNVKFGDLVQVTCPRSGLKFWVEVENKREGMIEPDIAYYTSHSNTDIRYPAVAAIEQGKKEGWTTWEQFKQAIHNALNPPAPEPVKYDFEGAWVASITGSDKQYRFERDFLSPVEKGEHRSKFKFTENGYYECCYKSRKGNESRYYYLFQDEKITEITLEQLEEIFPEIPEVPKEATLSVPEWLGLEGTTIQYESKFFTVVRLDGITGKKAVWNDFDDEWEHQKVVNHTTHLRPATEAEITKFQARLAANSANHLSCDDFDNFNVWRHGQAE